LVGTGVAILWYTVETSGMRQEMMASRQRLEAPELSIRFDQMVSGFFNLIVENISDVPARNVVFSGVPAFPITGGKTTADIGFLRQGIRYMAPKQIYYAYFLNYPALVQANQQNSTITLTCAFENTQGRRFQETVELNLSLFYDVYQLNADFQSRLIAGLESMGATLEQIRGTLAQRGSTGS